MNRSDWLEWRRSGIGASDVAGILGISPWTTPYGVWLSKVSEVAELDGEHLMWGHLLEDVICGEAARRLDVTVTHLQEMARHPDHPHHLATIDARTTSPIIEAKVTGDRSEWEEVPLHYWCQAQWQMHVTGETEVVIAVLHAGQRLDLHHVDRDADDIAIAVEAVERFWHDHVLTRRPPTVTGTDVEALNSSMPAVAGKALEATPEMVTLFRQWEAAADNADRAHEWARTLRARLCAEMADATDLIDPYTGRPLVTWRPTRELDTAAVSTAAPDVVAAHTRTVTETVTDWPAVRKALGKKANPYLHPTGARRWLPKGTPT